MGQRAVIMASRSNVPPFYLSHPTLLPTMHILPLLPYHYYPTTTTLPLLPYHYYPTTTTLPLLPYHYYPTTTTLPLLLPLLPYHYVPTATLLLETSHYPLPTLQDFLRRHRRILLPITPHFGHRLSQAFCADGPVPRTPTRHWLLLHTIIVTHFNCYTLQLLHTSIPAVSNHRTEAYRRPE